MQYQKSRGMTKQQKLQEIEQQIRKDIPRLMELTYGCIVENNYNKERSIYLGEVHQNETYKVFKGYNNGEIWIDYENYFWLNDYEDYAFTIIGHEIMLNDILEWLDDDYIGGILTNGIIGKRGDASENWTTLLHEENDNEFIFWDFCSPYLKDQSEELINFLYNLIHN